MLDFNKNHFQLFELPVQFDVDLNELAQRYRRLQTVLHPDRFAGASEQEKRVALQAATRTNEAYQTLRRPLLRAQYLLELQGAGMTTQAETTRDADFLMEQLELREALAGVEASTDPEQELADLLARIEARHEEQLGALGGQFDGADVRSVTTAQDAVRKLQFLDKLLAEAEAVEARLDEAV